MTMAIEFEIIDHGCDGSSYFPGCGVSFTRFTHVATGIGVSAREAANDAAEQMACSIGGSLPEALDAEIAELNDAPSFDPCDPEISDEWHHFVSIRWTERE